MDDCLRKLIMIILLGLKNKQINYIATFLQAPLDHNVYVDISKMFTIPSKVWFLKIALSSMKHTP